MNYRVAIVLALFVWRLAIGQGVDATQPAENQPTLTGSSWRDAIAPFAKKLSVELTVELEGRRSKLGGHSASPLGAHRVQHVPPIESVDELVKTLREWLPEAAIFRDTERDRCIHVVEKSLLNDPAYSLNRIASMKLTGTIDDLLSQLQQQSDGQINRINWGATPILVGGPDSRKVEVNSKDVSYREILTSAIPADMKDVIAWESTALEVEGKSIAYVKYSRTPVSTTFPTTHMRGELKLVK
jgi:hypothetical protein